MNMNAIDIAIARAESRANNAETISLDLRRQGRDGHEAGINVQVADAISQLAEAIQDVSRAVEHLERRRKAKEEGV